MGTTYSNCQVRTDSQEAVIAALTGLLKEPAYIAPAVNGWVGVYPEGDSGVAEPLAKKLSAKLSCGVFYWSVYDSDIFFYTLYEDGKKRDEFDSNPDYFETVSNAKKAQLRGKPEALLTYCQPGIGYSQVQETLHPAQASEAARKLIKFSPDSDDQYLFASIQAEDLAKLLGMNETLATLSYEYFQVGETGDYALEDFNLVEASTKIKARLPTEKPSPVQKKGVPKKQRDDFGVPTLVTAARLCRPDLVRDLLSDGYDVNLAVDASPLRSQQKRNPEVADALATMMLQRFGNIYENGMTALIVAAGASIDDPARQVETVRVLLEAGATVGAYSETGRTALTEAANKNAQVVEMLRAAGATE